MRKLRREVLRNKANKLSHYGKHGKSIKIFRNLWKGFKEARASVNAKKLQEDIKQLKKNKKRGLLKKAKLA